MSEPRYVFPGFGVFMGAAEAGITDPDVLAFAHRNRVVRACADILGQACAHTDPTLQLKTFHQAVKAARGIVITHQALDAMLSEVAYQLGIDVHGDDEPVETVDAPKNDAPLEALGESPTPDDTDYEGEDSTQGVVPAFTPTPFLADRAAKKKR